jgi:class 3 adenylate cyclase
MITPPETKFTQSSDVSIAYQVLGHGPLDLVHVPGLVSHLEYAWENPAQSRFLQRLASFSRLILFDKRGTGLSDRITNLPTLEERMDDVRAVMDAVGSERAALFGVSEGGSMSVLFAATYPQRVSALVLYGTIAKGWSLGDEPGARQEDEARYNSIRKEWGGPVEIELWASSLAHDEQFRQWWAKFLRLSAGSSTMINLYRMYSQIDVSPILPTLQVPTLVLNRANDYGFIEQARYLAEHIPHAKYMELSGEDHLWWVGDTDALINEIQEFLTGARQIVEPDRVLATVLFTDIVDSTRHLANLGDRRWRDLLDTHDAMVHQEVKQFQGKVIESTGDGFLATFDGPARAIRCALAISDRVQRLGIEIRAGLHTGEIELREHGIGGIAVHIAARVSAKAGPNEVWVSRTVRDLVAGSGLKFNEQGVFSLKGVPDEWHLFTVER